MSNLLPTKNTAMVPVNTTSMATEIHLAETADNDRKEAPNDSTTEKAVDAGVHPHSSQFLEDGQLIQVGVCVSVMRVGNVDTVAQQFEAKFQVQLGWQATEAEWQSFKKDNKTYKPNNIPQFIFPNAVSSNMTLYTEAEDDSGYSIKTDGGIDRFGNEMKMPQNCPFMNTVSYDCDGLFTEAFELESFPMDCQDLVICLEAGESCQVFIFVPYYDLESSVAEVNTRYVTVPEFHLHPPIVEYTTVEYETQYSLCLVRLKLERKYGSYFWRVGFFLAIISISALTSFSMDRIDQLEDRIAHLYTMLLTAAAFQFVVSTSLPKVAYLTLLDYYVIFSFGYIFCIAVSVALIGYYEARLFIDNIFFLIWLSVFILFNVVFGRILYSARKRELLKLHCATDDFRRYGFEEEKNYENYEVDHGESVVAPFIAEKRTIHDTDSGKPE